MVGGGQLARMTAAAAVGLGVTFRVLAESPSGERGARHARRDDRVASLPAGCVGVRRPSVTSSRSIMSTCPAAILAELESAGVLVRPGSAARCGTPRTSWRCASALRALGVPCPRFAAGLLRRGRRGVRRRASWPVVLKAVSGGYDGKGVWVCASAAEVDGGRRARHRAARRGVRAVPAGARGAGRQVTVRAGRGVPGGADRPGGRHLPGGDRARARAQPGRGRRGRGDGAADRGRARRDRPARRRAVRDARPAACSSTSWRCGRTTAGTGRSRARAPRSSSSTCARCSTCRSGPARRRTGTFTVMANLLGGTDPDVFDRYIHVMAADPAVKVHFYGKEVRARPKNRARHDRRRPGGRRRRASGTGPAARRATCAGAPKTATDRAEIRLIRRNGKRVATLGNLLCHEMINAGRYVEAS